MSVSRTLVSTTTFEMSGRMSSGWFAQTWSPTWGLRCSEPKKTSLYTTIPGTSARTSVWASCCFARASLLPASSIRLSAPSIAAFFCSSRKPAAASSCR